MTCGLLGGEIVVLSAETSDISKGMADKHKLAYPIIADRGLAIARAFGLVFTLPDDLKAVYQGFGIDLPKNTGHAEWELPVPARFVVDRHGIVRASSMPIPTTRCAPRRPIRWQS